MNAAVAAFVGLGANLGDPADALRRALRALDALPRTRLLRASRLYRSAPWGLQEQPDFVNAVALLRTRLPARALMDALLGLERLAGRDRRNQQRWGPRALDLDLLLYGDAVVDEPGLRIPHPHLHERAFALLPLLEIAPDATIPGIGPASRAAAAMVDANLHALG